MELKFFLEEVASATPAPRAKGLDLGTKWIVLAQLHEQSFEFRAQQTEFVSVPYSPVGVLALQREGVPHWVQGSEIVIYGNGLEGLARCTEGSIRRALLSGLLNPKERESLRMISLALKLTCGAAHPKEKICFSEPSVPPAKQSVLVYHKAVVTQILEDLGYEVMSVNEGLAVVYSELADDNFTGIAFSFGASHCNVCVAYLGLPVLTSSTAQAGDYVDENVASVTGETPARIQSYKEQRFALRSRSMNHIDRAFSIYYDRVIQSALSRLEEEFSKSRKFARLGRPMPVVLSGGSSMVDGFRDRFEEAIRHVDLPVEVAEVRLANDPLNATAQGAAIAAMLETPARGVSSHDLPLVSESAARPLALEPTSAAGD